MHGNGECRRRVKGLTRRTLLAGNALGRNTGVVSQKEKRRFEWELAVKVIP
jgi:hypothetical protein